MRALVSPPQSLVVFVAHAPLTGITRRPLEPSRALSSPPKPSQARPHQRSLLETGGAVLPIACFANDDQTLSSLAFFTVARHCVNLSAHCLPRAP